MFSLLIEHVFYYIYLYNIPVYISWTFNNYYRISLKPLPPINNKYKQKYER